VIDVTVGIGIDKQTAISGNIIAIDGFSVTYSIFVAKYARYNKGVM
jgi:hypothetical protein